MISFEPKSLIGKNVSLVPLSLEHKDDLIEGCKENDLYKSFYTFVPSEEEMESEIIRRNGLIETKSMIPFAVIKNNKAVGMTSYMNIDVRSNRLEIGSTWYRPSVQKTGLNTEAKYMLLKQAFEDFNCIAVEFRTHYLNRQSRKAIERLGAKYDGILRNHMKMGNGTIRDSVVYSIIDAEWKTVKAQLEFLMGV